MRIQPISYRCRYSNNNGNEDVQKGFASFVNKDGIRVVERFVDITPSHWQSGSCLIVEVSEIQIVHMDIKNHDEKVVKSVFGEDVNRLHRRWIYDRPTDYRGVRITDDEVIVPTEEQAMLIQALASNELRGEYANRIVQSLYVDLVVLNPKFGLKEWLPEVVKFHEELYEKYNFQRKSQ